MLTGYQGHGLDDNSFKEVAAMFAGVVIGMFRYLDSHRSAQLLKLFPVSKWKRFDSYGLIKPIYNFPLSSNLNVSDHVTLSTALFFSKLQ